MAVAAYASLVSLTHVLHNLHYRAQFHVPRVDINQLERLQDNVHSLLEFVEVRSENKSPGIGGLWRQISEVAFETEQRIDFHVVNLLHKRSQGETIDDSEFSAFCEDMERLISKIYYIKQELPSFVEEVEEDVRVGKQPTTFVPADGTSSSRRNIVVGIDEHVVRIMDKLTIRDESNLQILPIVGMGGIGKTTLARTVFYHQYIIDCFDIRLWVTISQEYSTEEILMGLLDERGSKETHESLAELGERLYKKLFGRKYLIVMDDMWTSKAWDDIKMFFPNNRNESRILLTTRLASVATLLGSHNPYSLSFLDEDKSWDLFCQTTFGQIGCPKSELAKIGREIAESCRGLPIEIVVIGRLLANSNMTREYWEFVAKNINSFSNLGDDERCLKILYLSYENLPIHLKPCFLSMRVFPEDDVINTSYLVGFWIAEGYIQLVSNKSMEEIGHEYFQELIDRNLIFSWGKEYCKIHDLLRDLCLRESNKECFMRATKVQRIMPPGRGRRWNCFLCRQKEGMDLPKRVHIFPSSSHLSPFVCSACETLYSDSRRPRLVRAMDGFDGGLIEIVQPFGLRYASITFFLNLQLVSPSRIHLLWNLQTLIMHTTFQLFDPIVMPPEIWEMPQLRVIDVIFFVLLPDPVATHIEGKNFIVLKDLHTLSSVVNFKCTKEILDRVPNLKDLNIASFACTNESQGDKKSSKKSLCNLDQLQKLESLIVHDGTLVIISFPKSLKSLSLHHYQMGQEEMSIVGSLPNLEALKLYSCIQGTEWNPVEGEFLRLKKLFLDCPDLVCWGADSIHFPVLEELRLEKLRSLKEIPSGIGDIATLNSIILNDCNRSVINSAKEIFQEQQNMGNESFILYIDWDKYEISATESNHSNSSD